MARTWKSHQTEKENYLNHPPPCFGSMLVFWRMFNLDLLLWCLEKAHHGTSYKITKKYPSYSPGNCPKNPCFFGACESVFFRTATWRANINHKPPAKPHLSIRSLPKFGPKVRGKRGHMDPAARHNSEKSQQKCCILKMGRFFFWNVEQELVCHPLILRDLQVICTTPKKTKDGKVEHVADGKGNTVNKRFFFGGLLFSGKKIRMIFHHTGWLGALAIAG